MPLPFGVNDCTAPWLWGLCWLWLWVLLPGLKPSALPLLGGVNRLPTLVNVVAGACDELT